MKQKVVAQFPYAAVKENRRDQNTSPIDWTYDIWTWNVYKMKWTRMSNHGCGFGSIADASVGAAQASDETAAMLIANRAPPPPLT